MVQFKANIAASQLCPHLLFPAATREHVGRLVTDWWVLTKVARTWRHGYHGSAPPGSLKLREGSLTALVLTLTPHHSDGCGVI